MNDKKGIICRILILDIFKKKKEGELIGSSPEEEYRYYKKRFLSNKLYVKKILAEYPELYRLYKVRSSKMSFLKKKMKEHLLDDDIQLDFILLKKGNKKVKRLVLHKGDIHRGGFCVSKIEFDNGSILYYKPHSLDKDIKYQQLYKYLCEKAGISCREVKCLSRPTYGWEENIENKSCNTKEEIERYSILRTVSAVERADVVMLVIDATEGITEQDAKIAGIAHERGKGVIIAVNKWDAIEKNDKTIYKHTNRIREVLAYMPYAELVFISAKTGLRISRMFETIDAVIENQTLRIQTGVLNEILSEAVAMQQPPSDKGKRLKIYYMTQVAVKPPTFVIFVNDKELMHFSYTRYLENKIRDAFGFAGTSLKFIIRERGEKE